MVFGAPAKLAEQHAKVTAAFSVERDTEPLVEGLAVMGSHWQIENVATGTLFLDDLDYTSATTTLVATDLIVGTRYHVRVRFRFDDGTWTPWGPSYVFTPYGEEEGEATIPAGGNYPTTPTILQPFEEQVTFRTILGGFGGKEQRDAAWSSPRRVFKLTYRALSRTDMDILWNFYISQKGPYGTFTFTDPLTSTAYTVRFHETSIQRTTFETMLLSTGIELIEVI